MFMNLSMTFIAYEIKYNSLPFKAFHNLVLIYFTFLTHLLLFLPLVLAIVLVTLDHSSQRYVVESHSWLMPFPLTKISCPSLPHQANIWYIPQGQIYLLQSPFQPSLHFSAKWFTLSAVSRVVPKAKTKVCKIAFSDPHSWKFRFGRFGVEKRNLLF